VTRTRLLDAAAVAATAAGLAMAFTAPPDRLQGDLQRLMYVHVPAAWIAYLAFAVTLVGSVAWLRTRRDRWDRLAASAAELGVVFTALALALGAIWGKPVWGVWWTWDPRLVTTALLLLVYLGYLGLRRATPDPEARARRAAILGVVAFVQVPIVHLSVLWWRTLHQPPTVLRPGDPAIDHTMLLALAVNVLAFSLLFAALLRRRIELARVDAAIERAPWAADAPVAGAAVVAPHRAHLGVEALDG
jgi:heme exporter protein C